MRKLIAIMTCHRKREWADAQRQTWVKDVVARGYADVRFLQEGNNEHRKRTEDFRLDAARTVDVACYAG